MLKPLGNSDAIVASVHYATEEKEATEEESASEPEIISGRKPEKDGESENKN